MNGHDFTREQNMACDGRDGERPVEWDGGHGLLVVRRLKAELKEIR